MASKADYQVVGVKDMEDGSGSYGSTGNGAKVSEAHQKHDLEKPYATTAAAADAAATAAAAAATAAAAAIDPPPRRRRRRRRRHHHQPNLAPRGDKSWAFTNHGELGGLSRDHR